MGLNLYFTIARLAETMSYQGTLYIYNRPMVHEALTCLKPYSWTMIV